MNHLFDARRLSFRRRCRRERVPKQVAPGKEPMRGNTARQGTSSASDIIAVIDRAPLFYE